MKKSTIVGAAIAVAFTLAGNLFIGMVILNPLSVQSSPKTGTVGKPIPVDVMKIAEKSCVFCHTEPGGNPMATEHLNLSKWDKYSAEKQASKAQAMSNMISKDKMPPKKFRETHPDGVLSDSEIKTINAWAQSIQVPKK
jgi:hypothetical protein